jgi:hypothetical protein
MTMYSHFILSLTTLTEVFPCFFLSCKGKTCKDGARPALFLIFVFFYVFLCCSMYCLFWVVLSIVCVYMCTELLPPGGYPIAVKYILYISYIIYRNIYLIILYIITYRIISLWPIITARKNLNGLLSACIVLFIICHVCITSQHKT